MKNKDLKEKTKRLQVDILSNFGNTGYQKISKDIYLESIPDELYELWYSPYEFSFRKLKDLDNIQYLGDNELLEYYSQLITLKSKLDGIFNNIEKQRLIKKSKEVNKKKINLLKKLIKLLEEDINNG